MLLGSLYLLVVPDTLPSAPDAFCTFDGILEQHDAPYELRTIWMRIQCCRTGWMPYRACFDAGAYAGLTQRVFLRAAHLFCLLSISAPCVLISLACCPSLLRVFHLSYVLFVCPTCPSSLLAAVSPLKALQHAQHIPGAFRGDTMQFAR